MMRTLQDIFQDPKYKSQAARTEFFKKNKIVVNQNVGQYTKGDIVTWRQGSTYHSGNHSKGIGGFEYLTKSTGGYGYGIKYTQLSCDVLSPLSKEALNDELKEIAKAQKKLTQRKKDVNTKLEFLKEAGVESFTDNEYKAYMTLKTIDKKDLSDVEKAQAIAKLIDA
jgi:hypothetical protein